MRLLRAPWWLCYGWSPRSTWCALDALLHRLGRLVPRRILAPICDRHDWHITCEKWED